MGFYILKNTQDKLYTFSFTLNDEEELLYSELYDSKEAVEDGVDLMRTIASFSSRYHQKRSDDDQHYFVIKAANDQLVATSKLFPTMDLLEEAIDVVMHLASEANVEDRCNY